MGVLFGILACWIIFSMVFAEIAPYLFEALLYLLEFIVRLLWIALRVSAKALYKIVLYASEYAWKALRFAWTFARVLIAELQDPISDEDECEEEYEYEADTQDIKNAYERALELFGLTHGFTSAELKRAYLQAIKRAHPDAGGSEEQAKEVNTAYDFLRESCAPA